MSELFDDIKKGLEEVEAILSGEAVAPYEVTFDGSIRVEERENGEITWKISDAIRTLKATDFSGIESPAAFFQIVREILSQSQAAMAKIYRVPVRTYERWEIDTNPIGPRSAAKGTIINLMATQPRAVVRAARKPARVGFLA